MIVALLNFGPSSVGKLHVLRIPPYVWLSSIGNPNIMRVGGLTEVVAMIPIAILVALR